MSKKMDRRGFLKALPFIPAATVEEIKEPSIIEDETYIRPPYISDDSDFSICNECKGHCVTACEEKILFRAKDGTPYVRFTTNGCTFCKKCAEVCEYSVLSTENEEKIHADFRINIAKCMAWNGTMCFSCKEPCIDNAIKFEGLFKPQIIPNKCTGCGFCINVCPSGAIEVFPMEKKEDENIS